jgi:hypothetical protein
MMQDVLSLVELALEEQDRQGFLGTFEAENSGQSVNCGSDESIGC